jgi:hypothetical protein
MPQRGNLFFEDLQRVEITKSGVFQMDSEPLVTAFRDKILRRCVSSLLPTAISWTRGYPKEGDGTERQYLLTLDVTYEQIMDQARVLVGHTQGKYSCSLRSIN